MDPNTNPIHPDQHSVPGLAYTGTDALTEEMPAVGQDVVAPLRVVATGPAGRPDETLTGLPAMSADSDWSPTAVRAAAERVRSDQGADSFEVEQTSAPDDEVIGTWGRRALIGASVLVLAGVSIGAGQALIQMGGSPRTRVPDVRGGDRVATAAPTPQAQQTSNRLRVSTENGEPVFSVSRSVVSAKPPATTPAVSTPPVVETTAPTTTTTVGTSPPKQAPALSETTTATAAGAGEANGAPITTTTKTGKREKPGVTTTTTNPGPSTSAG